jgi:hypothetical protein
LRRVTPQHEREAVRRGVSLETKLGPRRLKETSISIVLILLKGRKTSEFWYDGDE